MCEGNHEEKKKKGKCVVKFRRKKWNLNILKTLTKNKECKCTVKQRKKKNSKMYSKTTKKTGISNG